MKLNNKGFSLVELLIAFTAITLLSLAIFRTVITIQKRQQINMAYNDYIVFESTINSLIQKDFVNKTIEAIEYCGNNCYKIKYIGEAEKILSINRNDNILTYGNIKLKLPKTFSFVKDIEQDSETITGVEANKNNTITTFKIPIKSTILVKELDIIYIYQSDSRKYPIRNTI